MIAVVSKAYGVETVVLSLVLAAPFCLSVSSGDVRGFLHAGLFLVLSLLIALVWRAGLLRWGPSGSMLMLATAPLALVLLVGAVFLDVWPTPEGSLGLFVIAYPGLIVAVAACSGLLLHKLQTPELA